MASIKGAIAAHPAGTTAGVGGVAAGLIITYLHLTPEQASALVAAGGFLVTAVSWVAAHGGLKGLWNDLFNGASVEDAGDGGAA